MWFRRQDEPHNRLSIGVSMAKPIGVYYLNQSSDSEPNHYIELKEARRLKRENLAFFINHGKAIRLLESCFAPNVPDEKQKSRWIRVTYTHLGEPIGFTVQELVT